jgi:hypothetical protein
MSTDDSLRPFFYNDRGLPKVLPRVGAQAVHQIVNGLLPGIRVGVVYTKHTLGRGLGFKPYVHLMITKGGLINGEWADIDRMPGARLSATGR